jgi:hypothetical protein
MRNAMKALLTALAIAAATAPVAAANDPQPGAASKEETSIPSGGITLFAVGKGDTVYVRDIRARWYA